MDKFILIDDRDQRVLYSENDGWVAAGSGAEFGSTTHGVRGHRGAHALLTFTGTSVFVYRTISYGTQGNSTYSIDGSTPTTFTNPILSGTKYQQLFYQSPPLENKQHTLTIMPFTWSPDSGFFWLDYFMVTQPPNRTTSDQVSSMIGGSSPAPSSSLPNSTPSGATSTTIMTFSMESTSKATSTSSLTYSSTDANSTMQSLPVPVQSSAAPSQSSPARGSLTAVIVGSVAGGILVGLVISFFLWRDYKRRSAFHSISPTILTPTEPSRIHHAAMHDTRLFHKPGIVITGSLHPAEASSSRETRESVAILSPTFPLNDSSIGPPPTYSERMSPPVRPPAFRRARPTSLPY